MILKEVIVIVVLLYKADANDQWKAPSFISAWHSIATGTTGELVIMHGLNELPAKVDVQVKVVENRVDYIFTGAGTAHRDNDYSPEFGGVVYKYNTSHVIIYTPTVANNKSFGGVAYTGSTTDYSGPNTFRGWFGSGSARVRAWRTADFPTPKFTKIFTMSDSTCFHEMSHEYQNNPIHFVIAQIDIGGGYFTEGQGNIFQEYTPSPEHGMGGVLFGYNDQIIRAWSPTNEGQTKSWNGAVYVRHNGWGYSDEHADSGQVTFKGYVVSDVFRQTSEIAENQNPPVYTIPFGSVYSLDSALVIVQVKQNGCGDNDGIIFNGAGSAMTTNEKYSGVVYVYTNESVLLYRPSSSRGHMVYIGNRWGNGQKSSDCNTADIRVTFLTTGTLCPAPMGNTASTSISYTLSNGLEPLSTVTYACKANYQYASGDMSRTCTVSGSWNGTEPSCTMIPANQVVCPNPVVESARYMLSNGLQQGSIVNYTCFDGLAITSGSKTRICMSDGTWNGSDPVCTEVNCADPSVNLTTHYLTDELRHGSFVQYMCISGYEHVSGYLTRYCNNGYWIGNPPVCSAKPCSDPGPVWNAIYSYPELSVGSNVTYTCNTYTFHEAGDLIRTCEFGGSWSGLPPVCIEKPCNDPGPVWNAIYSYPELSVGSNVTYTCNTYTFLEAGDLIRTCEFGGSWSGLPPVCRGVSGLNCSDPTSNFAAHNLSFGLYPGSVVNYTCYPGYEYTSGSLTRTCRTDGIWEGTAPICSQKPCTDPGSVSNASYSYPGLLVGSKVTYNCNNNTLHRAGDLIRTCEFGGFWSGLPPVCIEINCADPGSVLNSTYQITGLNPGDKAIYTCYATSPQQAGNDVRICQHNGTWSGFPVVCGSVTACSANVPVIYTPEALDAQVQQTKKELTVEKKETSAYKRTLVCAKDSRPSATYIGSAGVAVLCSIALAIVIPDLYTMLQHIRTRPYKK